MSYERGWNALNLKMPPTIPHTEYCSHPELVKYITGLDLYRKLYLQSATEDIFSCWG